MRLINGKFVLGKFEDLNIRKNYKGNYICSLSSAVCTKYFEYKTLKELLLAVSEHVTEEIFYGGEER